MKKLLLLPLLTLPVLHCGKTTKMDVCEEEQGKFIRGEHYIDSSFLDESRNFNFKAWEKYREKTAKFLPAEKCIPVQNEKSLERRIQDLEETIDLTR